MSHATLARHLKNRICRPVYLFYGEEELLVRRALESLQAGLWPEQDHRPQKTILEAEEVSLAEVLGRARIPSLWSQGQLLILWHVDRYKTAELAPLGSYLDAPAPQTCLVLVAPALKTKEVDRHPYWRRLKDQDAVLGFFRLREAALPRWLQQEARRQGKIMAPAAAQRLIETVGDNLLDLVQELEKTILYLGPEETITTAVVDRLTSSSRSYSIFVLVDALGQRQPGQALQVLDRLLELGEPPLKILVMLARQLRLLIRCKEYLRSGITMDELANHLGVPRSIAQKLQRQATHFRLTQLQQHLFGLHRTDLGLKTSSVSPRLWLEKVILELCPPAALRS